MNYSEMAEAIRDAENTLDRADSVVRKLAPVMAGRLKTAYPNGAGWRSDDHTLAKLKRELKDYDLRTGKWKT